MRKISCCYHINSLVTNFVNYVTVSIT